MPGLTEIRCSDRAIGNPYLYFWATKDDPLRYRRQDVSQLVAVQALLGTLLGFSQGRFGHGTRKETVLLGHNGILPPLGCGCKQGGVNKFHPAIELVLFRQVWQSLRLCQS